MAVVLGEASREALVEAVDGAQLIAPDSLSWELGNAFSAMFRQGKLSLKEAQAALHAARQEIVDAAGIPQ